MNYPFAEHILTAVAACCALPDGTGSYENDLTASGVVVIDERFVPGAQVIVFLPDLGRSPAARLLKRQDRTATIYVQGKVGTVADYETRLRTTLRLANDCARAIESGFLAQLEVIEANLSNAVHSWELAVGNQSGLAEQGLGSFVLVFTVTYKVANYTGF